VPRSQRGGEVIEPLVSEQWFVVMEPLARPALAAVSEGRIKIVPERFEKVYNFWLENIKVGWGRRGSGVVGLGSLLRGPRVDAAARGRWRRCCRTPTQREDRRPQTRLAAHPPRPRPPARPNPTLPTARQDWCISRQLWWGHRIPVWYVHDSAAAAAAAEAGRCPRYVVARSEAEAAAKAEAEFGAGKVRRRAARLRAGPSGAPTPLCGPALKPVFSLRPSSKKSCLTPPLPTSR
jgi:hypothetical protein